MTSLPNRQRGVVLLVSLMLLLMLTILALTATNRSTLQERMAANSQDSNLAFQAAEAGRTAVLANIDQIRLVSPISLNATNIDNMRYCAQMTMGPLVLMNRNGRVYSNSLKVGPGTLQTLAVLATSQGTYNTDSACATALASHESGFAIPVFK